VLCQKMGAAMENSLSLPFGPEWCRHEVDIEVEWSVVVKQSGELGGGLVMKVFVIEEKDLD